MRCRYCKSEAEKHKLKARFYIRYVDDFVILHKSRYVLDLWKEKIEKFLRDRLRLEIHPDKTKIFSIYHGTPLLEFCVYYYYSTIITGC